MQELQPIGQNVILEIVTRVDALADQYKKSSGLLIAKDSIKQDEPNQGRVYAISPDIKDPEYQIGDLVVFHTKEIFQGFPWGDKKLVNLQHEEILAKLTEAA